MRKIQRLAVTGKRLENKMHQPRRARNPARSSHPRRRTDCRRHENMRHAALQNRMKRPQGLPYDQIRMQFLAPGSNLLFCNLRVNVISPYDYVNTGVRRLHIFIDMFRQDGWYAAVLTTAHTMKIHYRVCHDVSYFVMVIDVLVLPLIVILIFPSAISTSATLLLSLTRFGKSIPSHGSRYIYL